LIGIDIVDHRDSLLRKRDERAFRLIRHPADTYDFHGMSIENLFWLFWAAKESIYKAKRQLIRFDPKKIQVSLIYSENKYRFESDEIKGEVFQKPKYTLAICGKMDLERTMYEIFESNTNDQSLQIRAQMINHIESKTGFTAENDVDQSGLPTVRFNNKSHLATFTHHHQLMGYICEA
jgi:phosphopantetheinyl transferase (holo-ACP synthase)